MKIKQYMPFIFLTGLLVWAISQTVSIHDLMRDVNELSDDVSAVSAERERILNQMEPVQVHPVAIESGEIEKMTAIPPNIPLDDIALSADLQKYTTALCNLYDVPPSLVFAIGEHESGWMWPGEIIDSNELPSVGYMQINYPNFQWLLDRDIDVYTEHGNIHGSVVILSELLEKYPLEKAIVVYQCGPTGAQGIDSTVFSRWVLERMMEFDNA
jgi:hypothetical protein